MTFLDLLAWLVERSQRNELIVMLAGGMLAGVSAITTAHHLGINTNTNLMFPESLPWRHNAIAFTRDFPQFSDLLVAEVDGRIPEASETTAADLAAALALDRTDFKTVRRPDSSPFLSQEGLLFLDPPRLEAVLDRIIDAQPFLGELAADQSSRGLFAALSLLGRGVTQGQADLDSFLPALTAFHLTMAEAIDGHSQALSWSQLLGGQLAELAGQYKFALVQPTLDFSALEPDGAAAQRMRYFIMNWRMGQTSVLGSATARAILYSALTTASAFGALALSEHPGTASMGWLLLISLGCTLISSLVFLPALLAAVGTPRRLRRLKAHQG